MRRSRLLGLLFATAVLLAPGLQPAAPAVLCGGATVPMCDGDCPPAMMCIDFGGFCDCAPTGGPCGTGAGPPLCYGDCPPSMACFDSAGTCVCAVPTLSEWGIIGMSFAMFASVLYMRRRRTEDV